MLQYFFHLVKMCCSIPKCITPGPGGQYLSRFSSISHQLNQVLPHMIFHKIGNFD